jgi:anti-anti-sigma factor
MTDRVFKRSFDSIQEIADFTAEVFTRDRLDQRIRPTVDLALEELFTNMVKYSTTTESAVRIELKAVPSGIEVTLTDYGVERFDVTQAPEVNVNLPIEQRRPGGLGIHLIRNMVDALDYTYDENGRTGRTTFRKTLPDRRKRPRTGEQMLAIDFAADGSVVVVGRLDAAQCPAAQAFLDKVQGSATLDCSRLEYISSAGLGVLLKTQKRLMAGGGKLRLSKVNNHLQDVFRYSGFDQIFEIEPA